MGPVAYEYLEHQADVGIRGIGDSVSEALAQTAKAMFGLMVDVEKVEKEKEVEIKAEAPERETLLVEMLNELLYQQEVEGVVFGGMEVTRLAQEGEVFKLEGKAWGQPLNEVRELLKIEVKAATYSGLKYYQEGNQHVFQCVLDV